MISRARQADRLSFPRESRQNTRLEVLESDAMAHAMSRYIGGEAAAFTGARSPVVRRDRQRLALTVRAPPRLQTPWTPSCSAARTSSRARAWTRRLTCPFATPRQEAAAAVLVLPRALATAPPPAPSAVGLLLQRVAAEGLGGQVAQRLQQQAAAGQCLQSAAAAMTTMTTTMRRRRTAVGRRRTRTAADAAALLLPQLRPPIAAAEVACGMKTMILMMARRKTIIGEAARGAANVVRRRWPQEAGWDFCRSQMRAALVPLLQPRGVAAMAMAPGQPQLAEATLTTTRRRRRRRTGAVALPRPAQPQAALHLLLPLPLPLRIEPRLERATVSWSTCRRRLTRMRTTEARVAGVVPDSRRRLPLRSGRQPLPPYLLRRVAEPYHGLLGRRNAEPVSPARVCQRACRWPGHSIQTTLAGRA